MMHAKGGTPRLAAQQEDALMPMTTLDNVGGCMDGMDGWID